MAETDVVAEEKADAGESVARVYEVGYVIMPTVKEEEVEGVVGSIRSAIESAGGGSFSGEKANFIAEGAPSMIRLSYVMTMQEAGKRIEHGRGYFGWIKYEGGVDASQALAEMLKRDERVLRSIVFRTVREDTRAKMKAPTLREVKRTDTIRATPRRAEEAAGTVSEEDLEKALQDITEE